MKEKALLAHKEWNGKLETIAKSKVNSREELAIAYTPGVAEPCKEIAADISKAYTYTWKSNTVAVVSDGSAVLGLGNIGPHAAMPVMEGKCVLFKEFGGVNAVPICLDTQDTDEIIAAVKNIAPGFGGINLEDISAPRCFEIEEKLKEILDIPVFHDDQWGTAIIALSGVMNFCKLRGCKMEDLRVVMNGAGAAGIRIADMCKAGGVKNLIMCDSKGVIHDGRTDLSKEKQRFAVKTDKRTLADALVGADVFLGLSVGNCLTKEMVKTMNANPIIFAMANPTASGLYAPTTKYSTSLKRTENCFAAFRDALVDVTYIDTLSVLRQHTDEYIYFRTDHHWAALGAYYACQEFARTAGLPFTTIEGFTKKEVGTFLGSMNRYTDKSVPAIYNNPDTLICYEPLQKYTCDYYTRDYFKLKMSDKTLFGSAKSYTRFIYGDSYVAHIRTGVNNGRKLIVLKESYGNALAPFLISSFEEVYVIDMRYFKLNILDFIKDKGVTDVCFSMCAFTVNGSNRKHILRLTEI